MSSRRAGAFDGPEEPEQPALGQARLELDAESPGYGDRQAALFANAFKPLGPWFASTGLRPHTLRHRNLGSSVDTRVAEDFLVNSRLRPEDRDSLASIESYFLDPAVSMLADIDLEEPSGGQDYALPAGVTLRRELGDLVHHRRSSRSYTGDAIELDYLAAVIRAASGVTHHATVDLESGEERTLHFRATPSGGGLYPIRLYVAACNVRGLPRAVYAYQPRRDVLLSAGEEDTLDRLLGCFSVPEEVISLSRAGAVLLLVGKPWRSMRKYGSRGLRYLFIEAGAMAENIHLATAAVGYGSVDCASVFDDDAHQALGVDGLYETLIHTVVIGYPG